MHCTVKRAQVLNPSMFSSILRSFWQWQIMTYHQKACTHTSCEDTFEGPAEGGHHRNKLFSFKIRPLEITKLFSLLEAEHINRFTHHPPPTTTTNFWHSPRNIIHTIPGTFLGTTPGTCLVTTPGTFLSTWQEQLQTVHVCTGWICTVTILYNSWKYIYM